MFFSYALLQFNSESTKPERDQLREEAIIMVYFREGPRCIPYSFRCFYFYFYLFHYLEYLHENKVIGFKSSFNQSNNILPGMIELPHTSDVIYKQLLIILCHCT